MQIRINLLIRFEQKQTEMFLLRDVDFTAFAAETFQPPVLASSISVKITSCFEPTLGRTRSFISSLLLAAVGV